MKKIPFFIWLAMLLQACQTAPETKRTQKLKDPSAGAGHISQSDRWMMNPDKHNISVALTALKAYQAGDTAKLRTCVADSLTVYYDGGFYKGGNNEFMYAIVETVKALKNLRIKVKDWQSVISKDKQQEKVLTWYTQYWTNTQGRPDSTDMIDEALFKNGKIVVWYDYMRRYKK